MNGRFESARGCAARFANWRACRGGALKSLARLVWNPLLPPVRRNPMNLIRRWSGFFAGITLVAMFAGCAETEEGRTTQAQGAGLGALLGAAVGAGVGAATGGGRGAAIGAATGA